MILTLPVSDLITPENYRLVPGVGALEFKSPTPVFGGKRIKLFHSENGIILEDFLTYFDSILGFLQSNDIKMFSFDLGPAVQRVEIKDYYYVARSNVLSREEIQCLAGERIAYIRKRYQSDIALENLNYYKTSAYSYVCAPEFIRGIIRQNDIHMVLDLAHAVISARNMDIDIVEYLLGLPLERVKEVHVSAPKLLDGDWRDWHGLPAEEELELLRFIRKRVPADFFLVVEYYKDFDALVSVYDKLNKLK